MRKRVVACHAILKHKWYDLIEKGKKKVEYRRNIPYWRKRLQHKNAITFHRGFTNTTMTFQILCKIYKETVIEIYLGARLD